ncbi:MAG TPA: YihY/virulence factor BrkB family protein [Nitrospiraceae bacterium]|jgi:membrane protein
MKLFWTTIVTFVRALAGAMADFNRLGCMSLAASLSFFTLLSFFPMIGLLLYAIGLFASQDMARFEFLASFITGLLPGVGIDLVGELQHAAGEGIVGWIGLLAFIWFSGLVFYEVDYAVNVVFETAQTRNPLISTVMSVVALSFVELLMALSYGITQVMDVLVSNAPAMGGIDIIAIAAHGFLLGYILPFASVFATVSCLYRYLPKYRPTWRQAAVGGLVLTLLWEIAKHLFSSYVGGLTAYYNRMYGSLLFIVIFLLWVYYSAVLFLYSAAVVHRLQVLQSPSPPAGKPDAAA